MRPVPGGAAKVWRLTAEASRMVDVPSVEEYSPDPMVIAAVRLNRLVCMGLVRFVDERSEAIRLCREISAGLLEERPAGGPNGESAKVY